MNAQQIKLLSVVLIVLGIILVVWGFQMSGSAANEVAKSLTGSSTDGVTYRYALGGLSLVAGLVLFLKNK